jgi:hypothetical protein
MSDLGSTFVNGELNLSGRLGGMSTRAPVMYDDFDAVDGTKILGDGTPANPNRTAPTGQVWQGFGPGAGFAHITNGRMFSNAGNAYMFLPVASPITRQACTFSFTPAPNSLGDRTSATVVMLTLPSGFSNFTTTTKMLHLLVQADGWDLTTSTTGPSGLTSGSLAGGVWKAPLTTDGNVYQVAMEIDWANHAITVYGSDGSINTIIDNRVHNMQPLTVATPHAGDTITLNITPNGGSLTQLTYPVPSTDVATIAQALAAAVNGALAITNVVNGVTAEYSTGGVFNLFWFGSNSAPTVTTSITGPGATTTVTVGAATNAGVVVGGTGVVGDGTIAASDLAGVAYQFIDVTDFNNYYHSVSSGPNLSDRLASSGRAAPMGIVAPLYGNGGYTRRQPFSGITLAGGGNAWFRVLTGQAYFLNPNQQWGWAVAGRMRLDATDGAANLNAWEFDCNAILSGAFFPLNTPILTSKQGLQMSVLTSGLIQKARLSMNATTFLSPWCALDLFVAADSNHPTITTTISGEFEGYGTISAIRTRNVVGLETTRSVSIGGTAQNGDVVTLTITPAFGGTPTALVVNVGATDTLNSIATRLATSLNGSAYLTGQNITAGPVAPATGNFNLLINGTAPATSGSVSVGATTTITIGTSLTATLSFSNS